MEPVLTLDTVELVLYIVSFLWYIVMVARISRITWAWWAFLGLCTTRFSEYKYLLSNPRNLCADTEANEGC